MEEKRMRCLGCGAEIIQRASNQKYCRNCGIIERRERDRKRREAAREKKYKKLKPAAGQNGTPLPLPMESDLYGKNRCESCGHSCPLDNSVIFCDYSYDAMRYDLPPSDIPRPEPDKCIYWSKRPSRAGWLTEKEKREIYSPNVKAVFDMQGMYIYRSAHAAQVATGVSHTTITKECRLSDDPNYRSRRWRYLTEREIEAIKPGGEE